MHHMDTSPFICFTPALFKASMYFFASENVWQNNTSSLFMGSIAPLIPASFSSLATTVNVPTDPYLGASPHIPGAYL